MSFVDACWFTAGSSGTADFADGTALSGYRNMAGAGAADGEVYSYRAESIDRTEWEMGYGAYSSSGNTLARTVTASSAGGTTKVDFSAAPIVSLQPLARDFGNLVPFTPANASAPAQLDLAENTVNGSNKVTLQGPSALASDVTVTLPSKTGTVALESDIDRRNQLLAMCDNAKALAGYRRYLDTVAFGFKASGDADGTSSGGAVDTSAGAWKPNVTPPTTSYANSLGTGDRTATITVTQSSSLFTSGTMSNLVDGAQGTNSTDSIGSGSAPSFADGYYWQFAFGSLKYIDEVKFYKDGADATTTNWKWQYSTDGTTFTDLNSFTWLGGASPTVAAVTGMPSTGCTHLRMVKVGTESGPPVWYKEVEFKIVAGAAGTVTNATLITPYQTADAARTKVRGIFEVNNVDAGTLGTDWTVEYTCNGGTNWSAASTYTNCGKGQSGRTVVETEEVTCTSGTSFAARVKNLNNKTINVYKSGLKAA